MKSQNPNPNGRRQPLARILATAILSVILALMMTACSKATAPNPSKAGANSSSPNSTGDDLSGTYTVSGAGADGKTYQGTVSVTRRDAVYQMSWRLSAGNYDGIAVRSGNTVAATFTTGSDGSGCGAAVYQVNADNSLDGKWGEWGMDSAGAEKAVPVGEANGVVGMFNLSGINAEGSPYKGRLTITEAGHDLYQLAWETGSTFVGTGVRMGRHLAAGWGTRRCGFVIYEVRGDMLEGKWGVPGSPSLGTEKATKR